MASTSKHPPKPRATIEVEADWLEHAGHGSGKSRQVAVPPPLPPPPQPPPEGKPIAAPAPPPLAANSARHNTMPVEAQWLEVTELDAKLRASLAPLPPPDEKTRARMSSPIPREDPDDESLTVTRELAARPARRAKTATEKAATTAGAKKSPKSPKTAKPASSKR